MAVDAAAVVATGAVEAEVEETEESAATVEAIATATNPERGRSFGVLSREAGEGSEARSPLMVEVTRR